MADFVKLVNHGQRYLIYPASFEPKPRYVVEPTSLSAISKYNDIEIEADGHVKLRCYFIRQQWYGNRTASEIKPTRAIVIMFHGHTHNHGDILPLAEEFLKLRCDVVAASYRGYGHSEGEPSEKGIQSDAEAIIQYVIKRYVRHTDLPVIIYGQSLGGAVGIHLTSRHPHDVRALIIENTFTSVPEIFRRNFRHFRPLITEKWPSAATISKIDPNIPILMLGGMQDDVVPHTHMEKLQKIASNRNDNDSSLAAVRFLRFPEGRHTDTHLQSGYWEAISQFLDELDFGMHTAVGQQKADSLPESSWLSNETESSELTEPPPRKELPLPTLQKDLPPIPNEIDGCPLD